MKIKLESMSKEKAARGPIEEDVFCTHIFLGKKRVVSHFEDIWNDDAVAEEPTVTTPSDDPDYARYAEWASALGTEGVEGLKRLLEQEDLEVSIVDLGELEDSEIPSFEELVAPHITDGERVSIIRYEYYRCFWYTSLRETFFLEIDEKGKVFLNTHTYSAAIYVGAWSSGAQKEVSVEKALELLQKEHPSKEREEFIRALNALNKQ